MSDKKKLEEKIIKMNFEDALTRLEEIVEILSSKKIALEEMINLNEEGNLLKKHCAKRLDEAKMKIDIIQN